MMSEKTSATFRVDSEKWERFKRLAASQGLTATALITSYIDSSLEGVEVPSAVIQRQEIDQLTQSLSDLSERVRLLEELLGG